MCGICGFVGEAPESVLRAMASRLVHRGPDEAGYFREAEISLAIRRLSVIDVAGGSQPLRNETGQLVMVYNGEIYNHQGLRQQLQQRGHQLNSHSDGEVILHLYEEMGPECLQFLNGMFAIALWDGRKRQLFVARDRLGIKPLYYSLAGSELIFGSELKALLAHPRVSASLDRTALDQYLTFEYVPGPRSILQDVRKLLPGHYLLWQDGCTRLERYWSLDYGRKVSRSPQEWQEGLARHLQTAVRRQMISDVPLGAFLSGGLDSSSIVASMVEASPGKIRTFSIGFREKSFDESRHARAVADYCQTDHHCQVLGAQDILGAIPEVASFLDEPLGDASILPTYLLSRFARQHVTVVLSGDGGDELLAGYPTYAAARWAEWALRMPASWRAWANWLAQKLPTSTANWSLDYKIKRFLSRLDYAPEERNVLWVGSFSPQDKLRVCGPGLLSESLSTFEPLLVAQRCRPDLPLLERLLYLDLNFYLVDDLLVKLDRATMAVSLEGRVPFLDHELVEFLAAAPAACKLSGWKSKVLLKRCMRGRLPDAIIDRPKKGFGIPVAEWIKGPLRPWITDLLSDSEMSKDELFNPVGVQQMLRDHFQGKRDYRKQLWTLACFVSWRRRLSQGFL